MQLTERFLYNHRNKENAELNVWCAFPAVYNFGMSALGYLAVFQLIDSMDFINAERIFTDTENTQINVKDVNVITFSLSFELEYLGILNILNKYNIPFVELLITSPEKPIVDVISGGGII